MQELNQIKNPVAVGMSGGVDSSVAALLLKQAGHEVIGITMRTAPGCAAGHEAWCAACEQAVEDARRVADGLGIAHHVLDVSEAFDRHVVRYFTEEYLCGRTPNPCVMCNRYVKWEAILAGAERLGAGRIATGHYARIERRENGRFAVRAAGSADKDQTYALCGLTQEQLARTLFPLGDLEKTAVREIAEWAGLPVAKKRDSQEICFIPDNDYASFLERKSGVIPPPGNFVTESGDVLGRHRGITHYTIGQRRGLDLPMGRRVFVKEIRPETNEVVVGEAEEMFTDRLVANRLCFMGIPELPVGASAEFLTKIRYNHRGTMCTVTRTGEDEMRCSFHEPVRAVTPGQAVVFYDGPWVAGSGVICREQKH